jgi:hypothetical protein
MNERDDAALAHDEDERDGPAGTGRVITVIGAILLLAGLFLTWYEVVRANGFVEETTGWQTFTRLRFLIVLACVVLIASSFLRHTRIIGVARVVFGVVLAVLVVRRIVSPPDLEDATVSAKLGVYVSLLGALGVGFGGLMGLGADEEELEGDDGAASTFGLPAGPAGELPPAPREEVVDAHVVPEDTPSGRTEG